jgi:hypothetical protein
MKHKSKCCQADTLAGADSYSTTQYLICSKCRKPCDIYVKPEQKPKSEDWEDRFKLHADTQEWFIRQSDFEEAKSFISRLLKEQRKEIIKEFCESLPKKHPYFKTAHSSSFTIDEINKLGQDFIKKLK